MDPSLCGRACRRHASRRTDSGVAEAFAHELLAAARAGAGIAAVQDRLADGLERVLPRARPDPVELHLVAHVWEGIFLTFGDVVVKHGDAARARELDANARSAPDFATWTLRDLLDQRIAQAGERAALYLDEDPSNDPRTWMEEERICTGCHASTD